MICFGFHPSFLRQVGTERLCGVEFFRSGNDFSPGELVNDDGSHA